MLSISVAATSAVSVSASSDPRRQYVVMGIDAGFNLASLTPVQLKIADTSTQNSFTLYIDGAGLNRSWGEGWKLTPGDGVMATVQPTSSTSAITSLNLHIKTLLGAGSTG